MSHRHPPDNRKATKTPPGRRRTVRPERTTAPTVETPAPSEPASAMWQSYWAESRRLSTGFLFLLLPLVAYQVAIVNYHCRLRNAAELWMSDSVYRVIGPYWISALNFLLIVFVIVALCKPHDSSVWHLNVLLPMLAECVVYAFILYMTVGLATLTILRYAPRVLSIIESGRSVLLTVGAGVYEELLFRLLVMGTLMAGLLRLRSHPHAYLVVWGLIAAGALFAGAYFCFPMSPGWATSDAMVRAGASVLLGAIVSYIVYAGGCPKASALLLSAVVAAIAFSLAHHVGPLGERVTPYGFLYRSTAGVLLGMVFAYRGIGVAVGTHSIYNALVMVFG